MRVKTSLFCITTIIVSLCLAMAGCRINHKENTTELDMPTDLSNPNAGTTSSKKERQILEPSVFSTPDICFINALEYDRLYQISNNGIELLLDERLFFLEQTSKWLIYESVKSNKLGLWSMELASGKWQRLLTDIDYYCVHLGGDYLYYSIVSWSQDEEETTELFAMHIPTGETRSIALCLSSDFVATDESVYFLRRDPGHQVELVCYNPATAKTHAITSDSGSLRGYGSYIFFEDEDDWMLYDTKSGKCESIPDLDAKQYVVIYANEECVLYFGRSGNSSRPIYLRAKEEEYIIGNYTDASICAYTDDFLVFMGQLQDKIQYFVFDTRTYEYMIFDAADKVGVMFKDGDFPRIDTSTARVPIAEELYYLFVEKQGYIGTKPICSKTHGAWTNLAEGKIDFALLVKPTQEEEAYLTEKGVEVEMKPYGVDMLTFIGNPSLPVESLSADQIRDIYRGHITNWKEVGGPDHRIEVFYRNDQSGSQRLFESLVWEGAEIPEFSTLGFEKIENMMDIEKICMQNPYAIGYTLSAYIRHYSDEQIKRFAVDNAAPNLENLDAEKYPYITVGYVVIRSDEPANSPARRLFDWFGCAISKDIIYSSGVLPLD